MSLVDLVNQFLPDKEHNIDIDVTTGAIQALQYTTSINWASSRQNLSSGFLKKQDSNQSSQLQRQARKLKFRL